MKKVQGIILIIVVGYACSTKDDLPTKQKPDIPEHIQNLENLIVYSPDIIPPDTVELVLETIFENNEEVIIDGYLTKAFIDEQDKVYIPISAPGNAKIFVFNPDGSYITTFGRPGRGPGEFEAIKAIRVFEERVYVFAPRQQKVAIFSTDDFSLIKEIPIRRDSIKGKDLVVNMLRGNDLFVSENGGLILKMSQMGLKKEADNRTIRYYRLWEDGNIIPNPVLETKRFLMYYTEDENAPVSLPVVMPFNRDSFVSISEDGRIFEVWSEDFLVKQYDRDGNYLNAFYYPMKKSNLDLDEINIRDFQQKVLKDQDLPETWQAVHSMEIDDQGRFWVATITESDSTYTWWVLDQDGSGLARFQLPGRKAERVGMVQPFFGIQNGYFYTNEIDIGKGINRILKYRIEFKPSRI